MLTRVAIASSAVGGLPITCNPQGNSLDSISINFEYTLPTMVSRSEAVISLASTSVGDILLQIHHPALVHDGVNDGDTPSTVFQGLIGSN